METTSKGAAVIKFLKSHVMYVVLVVLVIFFATQSDVFLTASNLRNVVNQASYQIIVGVGLVFVMLSGAMDLSVGYQMSLAGVVMGKMLTSGNYTVFSVIVVGIILGLIMNLINGTLFITLKVFPFVLTLATQYIFNGLSYIISQSATSINFPDSFKYIGQGYIGPIPVAIIIMILSVLFASFMLNKTYFGRYVYALGGNVEAAVLAGVNVKKNRYIIYAISGFFVALGTIVLISRAGSAASSMGPGTEFTIISGGILGGISLTGGTGKISHIVLGVLILTILSNGMQLMQLGVYPQYVAKGLVLIIAIAIDTYQKNAIIRRAKKVEGTPPSDSEAAAVKA
ncbi:MAG: ABC transporter permease [Oscillospiraceae bacterium]|jgi:ribose transport system permease protein